MIKTSLKFSRVRVSLRAKSQVAVVVWSLSRVRLFATPGLQLPRVSELKPCREPWVDQNPCDLDACSFT